MLNFLMPLPLLFSVLFAACRVTSLNATAQDSAVATRPQRLLYVAAPGIRNYLEYGGHGLIVFNIDNDHKFVKRIPTGGLGSGGKPLNVKGICASSTTGRLYISTIETLQCIDLTTEALLWERALEGGCDRMSIAPDGSVLYVPSTGDVIEAASKKINTTLTDETGAAVMSEKMVEVQFENGQILRTGDQFGVGRVLAADGIPGSKPTR